MQSPTNYYVLVARSVENDVKPKIKLEDYRTLIDYSKTIPVIKKKLANIKGL
ncbi:MAG: hypothetical protein F7B60_01895 [Desulfurococcales archaeon]|nr:hypothetical protein [Desulfurococcales archaeon]